MNRIRCLFFLLFSSSIFSLEQQIPQLVLENIQKHVMSNGWNGENGWGANYYNTIATVINQNNFKNILEVGVGLGGHAEYLLKNTFIDVYFGVDPYTPFDVRDGFQSDVSKYSDESVEKNFSYLFEWVKNYRLIPFGSRVQLFREDSVSASKYFENESLDCIFIDGNHRYDAVLEDLKAWFPKLKKNGLMLGDDYWMIPVASAVQNFSKNEKKEVFFITSKTNYKVWVIRK